MLMFKMIKRKKQAEVSVPGTKEESQDDSYRIPVLHAAPLPNSPELLRRQKEEQLRKRYNIYQT